MRNKKLNLHVVVGKGKLFIQFLSQYQNPVCPVPNKISIHHTYCRVTARSVERRDSISTFAIQFYKQLLPAGFVSSRALTNLAVK